MFGSISELPTLIQNSFKNVITFFFKTSERISFHEFLPKHMKEFEKILNKGINIENIGHFKVSIKALIGDLPALAKLLNINQFNGKFGCVCCLNEGKECKTKRKRIYLYNKNEKMRTNETYLADVKEANKTKTLSNGILVEF